MIYFSTSCLKSKESGYEKDVFKVLEAYKELGIKNVELSNCHSKIFDEKSLIDILADFNCLIHMNFPNFFDEKFYLNISSSDFKIRSKTIKTAIASIDFASKINAKVYSIHAGAMYDSKPCDIMDQDTSYALMIDSLKQISEHAVDHGLIVALENNFKKNCFLTRLDEFESIIIDAGCEDLMMLCDLGHSNIVYKDKKELINSVKRASKNIIEFHLHINNGLVDEHKALIDREIINAIQGVSAGFVVESRMTIKEIKNYKPFIQGLIF